MIVQWTSRFFGTAYARRSIGQITAVLQIVLDFVVLTETVCCSSTPALQAIIRSTWLSTIILFFVVLTILIRHLYYCPMITYLMAVAVFHGLDLDHLDTCLFLCPVLVLFLVLCAYTCVYVYAYACLPLCSHPSLCRHYSVHRYHGRLPLHVRLYDMVSYEVVRV